MKNLPVVSDSVIINKIFILRGQRVMLSSDLAELYGVTAKRLNEQVRRNLERFPGHYMFILNRTEYLSLRSQNATLKKGAHSKYLPYVFTERGVMMLANVLKSKRAVMMSLRIIDVFIQMQEVLMDHKNILVRPETLEK
jgi:phage regulator Rha-like protein